MGTMKRRPGRTDDVQLMLVDRDPVDGCERSGSARSSARRTSPRLTMGTGVDEAQTNASVGREAELGHVELRPLLAGRPWVGVLAVVDCGAIDEAGLGRRRDEALRERPSQPRFILDR